LAFHFCCISLSTVARQASHPLRASSKVSVSPERSQPSNFGSSPATLAMSKLAKSNAPSLSSRSTASSGMPTWSYGAASAVIWPFEAAGIHSFQSGASSSFTCGVGLSWISTLK
jgi:hypothetical protein